MLFPFSAHNEGMKTLLLILSMTFTFAAEASIFDRARKMVKSKAEQDRQERYAGVRVMFKDWDSDKQDQIHRELNTELKNRSALLKVDVVQLAKKADNDDLKKLKELCKDYYENELVHYCAVSANPKHIPKRPINKIALK